MSAANVVLERHAAHLFTDSAGCDGLGRVKRLASKVRVLPGGRCAFSLRGHLAQLEILAAVLPTLGSDVDELRAAAADGRLRAALGWRASLRRGRLALLLPFDITVVGWGRQGPAAFMFWNHGLMRSDDGAAVEAPFAPRDIPWANVLPPVPLPAAALQDPLGRMPEIVERQREHAVPSFLLPKGRRCVGGYIEHTVVTAAGARTRRVGGWDEPLGQVIGGGVPGWRVRWRIGLVLAGAFVAGEVAQFAGMALWRLAAAHLAG